ncbi:MAG: beta-phosphoglucomutase family hydrolase [Bacteroidales bacterium]|nr:beta-phosphoglucomutase family hydrolase [Bacteroidales bacterium]
MQAKHKLKAVIFDLDGVITKTALVHSIAWKEMFDNYLHQREVAYGEVFKEFTHEEDYLKFVDGKPRYEGVKSFLESRSIKLPYGEPTDGVEDETYCGIGNRKNIVFNDILKRDGIEEYPSTVELIHRLKAEGIKVGVASSSKNAENVLRITGLINLIETRVDGVVSAELGLNGKPAPDIFTTAADNLGVNYDQALVIEDAISGVQAARAGNFGMVLGLAREDNELGLWKAGADKVVSDISEIGFDGIIEWFEKELDEDNWSLSYHDYDAEKERSREALLTVGNGYFGTRGALCETDINEVNYPGTYMAGLFNRLPSEVNGRELENEDFVNAINWLPITFKIDDGDWMDINCVKILSISRKLDFKTGVLNRELKVEDTAGNQTIIYTRRYASMDNPNIAGIHYCLQPINYSANISVKSSLKGNHINEGVKRYAELNQQHLIHKCEKGVQNIQALIVATRQSNVNILTAARLEVLFQGENEEVDFIHHTSEALVDSYFSKEIKQGEYLGLMKTVWIEQSNEYIDLSLKTENILAVGSFQEEMDKSSEAWKKIWEEIDIEIEGDRLSQKMTRMHLYHLMSGTSPHNVNIDFSVPARGLTGEAYRGHIFWDELYILPVYFVHYPEIAKSLLMYRYHRLDEARKYAAEFNFEGAMFPWQSGSDGREETQKFHYNPLSGDWGDDYSALQRHVSLAVAYNIINYFHYTDDEMFMQDYGIEMLLEIARFWKSKSTLNPTTGKYSIDKVMGPDEFHEAYPNSNEGGIRDNAYTNLMSVWMWNQINDILPKINTKALAKVYTKIKFASDELEIWNRIASNMNLVVSQDGIIAQYDGYFDLEELDWDYYRQKYGNIHRMDRVLKAEGKSPDDYKVAKQADTLMLFYNLNNDKVTELIENLGIEVPNNYIEKNLEYYLKRTSHGSTLSRVVHSYLAQQIGMQDLSWEMFQQAITSDYNDIQGGTTAEGIHTGVMAGTIWIIYTAFGGIDLSGETPKANPKLPKHWRKLSFKLKHKGKKYKYSFEQ